MAAMEWHVIFATLAAGLVSGFLTVTAGAAVTVVVPALIALGLSADDANATSRFSLAVGGAVAGVILIVKNKVDWKSAWPLLLAAGAGTIVGATVGARVSSAHMLTIIVVTSAISLVLVYLKPDRWLATTPTRSIIPPHFAALLFFVLCVYEGVVAVDSALLRLIALVYLLGYPLASANPIKLITGLVMFGISSAVYAHAGEIDWAIGGWLAVGSVVGACIAVPFACSHAAQKGIYRMLQVVVTVETLWLIWHWWRVR